MTVGMSLGVCATPQVRRVAVEGIISAVASDSTHIDTTAGLKWGKTTGSRWTGSTGTSRVQEPVRSEGMAIWRMRKPENTSFNSESGITTVTLQNRQVDMVFIVNTAYPSTGSTVPSGIPVLWRSPNSNVANALSWTSVSSIWVLVNHTNLQITATNATATQTTSNRTVTLPSSPNPGSIVILQFAVTSNANGIGISARANINGVTVTGTLNVGGNTNGALNGSSTTPTALGRPSESDQYFGRVKSGEIDYLEIRIHSGVLSSANSTSQYEYLVSKYLTDV